MQKKKIFIEINLSPQLKKRLAQKIAPWRDLPVKWMKEENLHLTIAFVGYVDESVIPDICENVAQAVADFEVFDIALDTIELGPHKEDAKLVWLTGQPSVELGMLNEAVERALGMQAKAHKEFRPHITLGRIRKHKWEELNEKPVIKEKMNLAMTIDHVSVMESKGGGAEYISLEECPLQ